MSSPNDSTDSATSLAAAILPKLRETRRIVEGNRSSLLDVIVWLNEIEDDILKDGKAALHTALDDLSSLTANRLDSEAREYQPEDDRRWCP